MERRSNKGDFEKLLRDYANQYKMYPSTRVWDSIHSSLHRRRRWGSYTIPGLILISVSVVSVLLITNISSRNNGNVTQALPVQNIIEEITQDKAVNSPVSTQVIPFENNISSNHNTITETRINKTIQPASMPLLQPEQFSVTMKLDKQKPGFITETFLPEILDQQTAVRLSEAETAVPDINSGFEKIQLDPDPASLEAEKAEVKDLIMALASKDMQISPMKKQSRITGQLFLTPTISYRKLSENKRATPTAFNYAQIVNINSVVNHKPAMGFEFGFEGKYRATDNLAFTTGLQFNINRYDIRAYNHPTEVATVAVRSGFRTDSLASLTNYRNFNGYSTNWLENFYFQVAFPLGAELRFGNNNKTSWGISGSLQPTYNLGDRAYLISSDYKNYAKFPDLIRRWNLSSSVELFANYSTGKIRWQTGPHFRYQHLSSFVTGYPVKENLYAIGLKVAATFEGKK